MATFYSTVGAKVTIIASTVEILPKVEQEAAKIVREKLERNGVVVKLSVQATKIVKRGANAIDVELSDSNVASGSVLLNAAGY